MLLSKRVIFAVLVAVILVSIGGYYFYGRHHTPRLEGYANPQVLVDDD